MRQQHRPSNWRGPFYLNPDDPHLFAPKRSRIGTTINFAHRWAWPVLALMLAVPLAAAVAGLVLVW